MKTKRIIACIISCILFIVCVPFAAVAEDTDEEWLYYETVLEYESTSNTDGTKPITNSIRAVVKISQEYRNECYVITDEEIICNYPIRIKTDFYDVIYAVQSVSYTPDFDRQLSNSKYAYYGFTTRNFEKRYYDGKTEYNAGSKVPIGFVVYHYEGSGLRYYMKSEQTEYKDITYNNGSSVSRIKTDTDVSDIQKYIDELEAENALLRQENTELKNRINLLSTGIYGDVNGDQVVDVQDAQIILAYYTERDVAKKSVPDLVTFGLNFGKN